MAEVNISEGIDLGKVTLVKEALLLQNDVELIDLNSDSDHNRTVFTFRGEPKAVLEGAKRLAQKAIELIDMTQHKGSHPRMGAVDVVPFIPVRNVATQEAIDIAKEFGSYLGGLGVPVYYYEEASDKEYRKTLVAIRKGQYEGLEEKMKDPDWVPNEGPKHFVAKSGATVTGVRFPLVAFNVNINTSNLDIGKKVVKAVRGATGGYQSVRAIALPLEERNIVQISMNLTHYEKTPIHRVFETIKSELDSYGVGIVGTELVGPVPVYALEELLRFYLRLESFSIDQIYM